MIPHHQVVQHCKGPEKCDLVRVSLLVGVTWFIRDMGADRGMICAQHLLLRFSSPEEILLKHMLPVFPSCSLYWLTDMC